MRIVIDLQGAQGGSRHRGIGRYCLALAQAMVRNRNSHEIIIALNGMFPDTIEPIRAAFDGLLPQENIRCWHAAGPVHSNDSANVWLRQTAEIMREVFLANLKPDILHVTSLFEGFKDDAVHSIGLIPISIPTAVTFYDLIPLIQSDIYLKPNPLYETFYRQKLAFLKKADIYLAISESSRQEIIDHLSIKAEQVVNIASAVDIHFKPIHISETDRNSLRNRFGITRGFVMYSGATDERKNHLRLIKAFSLLPSGLRKNYQLVIVGYLPPHHREKFELYAKLCGLKSTDVVITGRVTDQEMVQFYNLCTLFVFPSLHEGFGLPALEAMSCGAPVIGSNTSSLPEVIGRSDALFDPFDEKAISQKIAEVLLSDTLQNDFAKHGLEQAKKFSWDESAKRAIASFERYHIKQNNKQTSIISEQSSTIGDSWLIEKLAKLINPVADDQDWIKIAGAIAQNVHKQTEKQLLVDISELAHRDHKTGIQRVVRSILAELLANPPQGFKVELVYATPHEPGYRYARQFTQRFLGNSEQQIEDEFADLFNGDIFLGLDLQHHVVLQQAAFYAHARNIGVRVFFVVYDLLPVLLPKVFPDGTAFYHAQWLDMLAQTDGVLCISRAVADEMAEWLTVFGPKRLRPFNVGWFHLGADVACSAPSKGLPVDAGYVLKSISKRPTFLSVGTVEPRKGQLQTLTAFETLWSQGVDINLVLVGKHGWNVDLLVEMLRGNTERNRRLFWLEGISDEYLEKVYAASTCLIAASEGEGFGLPLIEAAQHKKPIIARDIPVFREVAGENAFYFSGLEPNALADAVREWLVLNRADQAPQSDTMPWLTWKQSTQNLLDVMLGGQWYQQWMPDEVHRYWGSDSRLGTQVGQRTGRDIVSAQQTGYLLFGPYIALAAGQYRVTIYGAVGEKGAAGAHMDVAVDKGNVILAASVLDEPDQNGVLIDLAIMLDSSCTDLEVRVWVSSNSDLRISMIEIAPWRTTDVYRFAGSNNRFTTQVGKREDRHIVTTSQTGYLLFGPYIPLDAGRYKVTIHGKFRKNNAAGARMDIAVDKGSSILGMSALSESDENDNLATLLISLNSPCTDLEVRIWVSESTDLKVSMIEIAPWQSEPDISNINQEDLVEGDPLNWCGVPIESSAQVQRAQTLTSAPGATEISQNVAAVKSVVNTKVLLQKLTDSLAVTQPFASMSSTKLEVTDNDGGALTALESAKTKILSDHNQASNNALAPKLTTIPAAIPNKLKPLSTERNRAKVKQNKKR